MRDHVDCFKAAVTLLAGHGHIKQRLIKAYEENLAEVSEDDLPIALRQDFSDLKRSMHHVTPLNGEGHICASVRKMSVAEASDCALAIVSLYSEVAKYAGDAQAPLAMRSDDPERVPPFLVKSV